MRRRSTSVSRRVAVHRDGCGQEVVERGDIGSSQKVGGVGRSSLSAHLEMLLGCSVRSFQVVIRTCVLGGVPSLCLREFEPVQSEELGRSNCGCLYSGTERRFWTGGIGCGVEIAVKVLGSRISRKKETRERRSVGEDASFGGSKLDGARNGRRSSYATTGTTQCRSRPDRIRIDAAERRWRVKSSQVQGQFDEQEQE